MVHTGHLWRLIQVPDKCKGVGVANTLVDLYNISGLCTLQTSEAEFQRERCQGKNGMCNNCLPATANSYTSLMLLQP